MDEKKFQDLKAGERGAVISIFSYLFLSVFKLLIGITSHSEALKADGLNNTTDIIASVAVLIGLRLARKPADEDHPYGHWRAETVASLMASFIMMMVGLQVLFNAVSSIFHHKEQIPDWISAWAALFGSFVMFLVYLYNRRLAKRINSQSVMAAAKDNLSDALVGVGTAIGIIGSQFHLAWLDPLAAVIIGLLICRTAWEIFRDASHDLTDGFDEGQLQKFKETVLTVPGVIKVKSVKARKYGNNVIVDIVILVDPTLDVRSSHGISDKVENILTEKYDVFGAHVHIEPKD
ncbi:MULTISPECIES: cation diffusion facilitator family transporter [Bacillus]|jgi:cation diffusion facilitator family transporter|uniref:cation diffusion facilitator family transporter n=1 Tax=Bacillus TaxID=1386 RepID=UPI00065E9884|nr:cation diffusion facilitator family transporter [Bacillus smithii]AKP46948.1 Cobalt-zinc-cadmium resistance protein [Bacillus smithii]MED0660525.1 cation diffusion facilitator family transporter [Bacillus smithii]MED4882798.1 cation diffusion facilitator family transporter [Bacillus smithii]MED4926829.1 cation diffusion facilitator family transporter [Bacillus smithii]